MIQSRRVSLFDPFNKKAQAKTDAAVAELAVWMDPGELSQLRGIIETVAPKNVLEWGSGGSTRELLATCPFIERYVSIEHDETWSDMVRNKVTDARLELHHVPAERPVPDGSEVPEKERKKFIAAWYQECERDASWFTSYIDRPRSVGGTFDFVLVDGRARVFCALVGFELLRPGGVLVMHDAQRTEYHDTLNGLGRAIFLEPWAQGQICLVRKPG